MKSRYEGQHQVNSPLLQSDIKEINQTGISASKLGSLVHKILEHLNTKSLMDEKEIIGLSLKEVLGDELIQKLEDKMKNYLLSVVNKYVDNYKRIIEKVDNSGKLILEENEAYFLSTPIEDKKMRIMGFIDRLQVFNNEGKAIDSIKLRLFLLDIGECIELPYEEKEVEEQLEFMDKNFTKDFSVLDIKDFSKEDKESCNVCPV